MRYLHAAAVLNPPAGVVNQMRWEQAAADRLGLAWDARIYCPAETIDDVRIAVSAKRPLVRFNRPRLNKLSAWTSLRTGYYRWLEAQTYTYDAILLRYYPHDPMQVRFIRRSRVPVYLVHHTLETQELRAAGGVEGRTRAFLEDVFGPFAIRECAGVIGVTREIIDYERRRSGAFEKQGYLYPNGITYSGCVAGDERSSASCPELLFVASSFVAWHGLDLLLDAAAKDTSEFLVHLVGDLNAEDRKRTLTDRRFKIHGRLSNERISELASRCSLGLSSFALFRNRMEEACTLKVREYLMLGLPVYAGYRDVLPPVFDYFRSGPVTIPSILSYAAEVNGITRQEVSTAARPHIDKGVLLARLVGELTADRDRTFSTAWSGMHGSVGDAPSQC